MSEATWGNTCPGCRCAHPGYGSGAPLSFAAEIGTRHGVFAVAWTAMASDLDTGVAERRRRKRKLSALLVLATGVLFFAAAGAGLYLVLRPVTLRIAVGPPGSDDQKLIQALAQTFARDKSSVRLAPVSTESAAASIAPLKESKTDPPGARGDPELPAGPRTRAHPPQ